MPLRRRSDGELVRGLDPVRRFLPFLMPTRTESFVLCRQQVDPAAAKRLLAGLNAGRAHASRITLFHLLLRAVARVLEERPRLNRFVAGGRIYQRRGVWISFSAKRSMDEQAPIFSCKREFFPDESIEEMVDGLQRQLGAGRAGEESVSDREVAVLLKMPAWLLRLAMKGARVLNALNLWPRSMIAGDPMFASVFVANLGSVGIDACYHHNYEHGTIPIFITMGRSETVPVVVGGERVEAREMFELKYTYDERIEDGLYCARALERLKYLLENPAEL